MKSKKPFSTVSYNTKDFLRVKLTELYQKRIIDFFAFVEHYPEEDEKKSHIHVYMMPNGTQDTDQLREELLELDPNNYQPLGCLPFNSSKWSEWKQYCDHDPDYLASKGQTRKYRYVDMDYVTSDETYFQELNHTIDRSKFNRNKIIIKAVEEGRTFADLVKTGQIPVQMIGAYKMMYDIVLQQKLMTEQTYRGIDEETGEVRVSHTPKDDNPDLPF